MLVMTNGQYGWETMWSSAAYSAGMAAIQADTQGGGDWEDYFWMNMATSFVAVGTTNWAYNTDAFFAPIAYSFGTMYGMGSSYENCRKRYKDKWSDGKVQGVACAGVTYAGGVFGQPN